MSKISRKLPSGDRTTDVDEYVDKWTGLAQDRAEKAEARVAELEAERDEARSKLRGYETAPAHVAADVLLDAEGREVSDVSD